MAGEVAPIKPIKIRLKIVAEKFVMNNRYIESNAELEENQRIRSMMKEMGYSVEQFSTSEVKNGQ